MEAQSNPNELNKPALPDSKAGSREIAIKRNANANSAIGKGKVASREAVSKADDRPSALD